jgi:FkbM family methyltransferase
VTTEDKLNSKGSGDAGLGVSEGVRWSDRALVAYGRAFEHPSKIRIVRWLVRRLAGGAVCVRYAPGAVISIDPSDYIGWAVFRTGQYEPASLSRALRIVREDPGLFVDVGANFGWYTCAVGAIAGASVVSIEPDCENCALLRRNIALNERQNPVVFNGAVGPDFAPVRISRRARGNSGTVAIDLGDQQSGRPADWVATVPLEGLLKRVICPPVRPVLLKIDVEGFERQVLSGLDFQGPFRPKNILMEFDRQLSAWRSFGDLHSFFAAHGYELLDVFGNPLRDGGAVPEENVWARERKAG